MAAFCMRRVCISYNFSPYFSSTKCLNGVKLFSNDARNNSEENKPKLSGFAKSFIKQQLPEPSEPAPVYNFAALLRNSKFIDLGDPEGKIVTGKIFHVVGNDLYIDFGWKFHTVCTKPARNGEDYVRGATVRLKVKDLELSTRFLGGVSDLTLLEADCILLGLINTPARPQQLRGPPTPRSTPP